MTVKLPTEQHLEFLRLKGGYTGSSESTHVKMPHCWKSRVMAHICFPVLSVMGRVAMERTKDTHQTVQ